MSNSNQFEKFEKYIDLLVFFGAITKDSNMDCFIPSYSALGLSVPPHTHIKNYLNANMIKINNNDRFYLNTNKTISPFDYLYIEEANGYHISDPNNDSALTSSMVNIMKELLIPTDLVLGDRIIHSGQSVCYEAPGTITVNGNFIVETGGHLELRAGEIKLNPGFKAEVGSTVSIVPVAPLICPPGTIP